MAATNEEDEDDASAGLLAPSSAPPHPRPGRRPVAQRLVGLGAAAPPRIVAPFLAYVGPRKMRRTLILLWLCVAAVVLWHWVWWMRHGQDAVRAPLPLSAAQPRTALTPRTDLCRIPTSVGFEMQSESPRHAEAAGRLRSKPKVLIIPKTTYSQAYKAVLELLGANRIKYKVSVAGKRLPDLIKVSKGMGNFGAIFFEDFRFFLQMDPYNRKRLLDYCKAYNVGILSLVLPPTDVGQSGAFSLQDETLAVDLPLRLETGRPLRDVTVNASSPMLRLTRGGQTERGQPGQDSANWVTFLPEHPSYSGVAAAERDGGDSKGESRTLVLMDHGELDALPKVLFGGNLSHFVNKLLLLDALHWISAGRISVPLTRHVLVDIDDIFVGKHRMLKEDVDALLDSQERIASQIPGFKFNLGFSGGFYRKDGSLPEEKEGDEALIAAKDRVWWFPHSWMHFQAHKTDNVTFLVNQMMQNKVFAEEHGIPVTNGYSVAPHHSGVYPVHQALFDAWKSVWNITVTSTEEYPHLRPRSPGRLRHGFIHSDIRVLPRQTCGLFTKNLFYSEYPGGPEVLEDRIHGGELFMTIVNNPISIFMTHMPNYCEDRLALYTFESVFHMIQCWTNLKLSAARPAQLAEMYFKAHPEEKLPIWGDPCDDDRHREIWSDSKSCGRLPEILVVGPQKTGSTALYKFLNLHPTLQCNLPSERSFEELQFFSGQTYLNGVDWYMDHFQFDDANSARFFEKSATYFDSELAPLRARRLIPSAHVVALIAPPAKRAYSWYQHMIAHGDATATSHSFLDVVSAGPDAPKAIRQLQSRCLEPGKYAAHLERWLDQFKVQQLHIVDGEELRRDPVAVMNRLQREVDVRPFADYSRRLRFSPRKGFFCEVTSGGRTKCLGKSKGRQYEPMEAAAERFLREYYRLPNEALIALLRRLGEPIPVWLEQELGDDGGTMGSKANATIGAGEEQGADLEDRET